MPELEQWFVCITFQQCEQQIGIHWCFREHTVTATCIQISSLGSSTVSCTAARVRWHHPFLVLVLQDSFLLAGSFQGTGWKSPLKNEWYPGAYKTVVWPFSGMQLEKHLRGAGIQPRLRLQWQAILPVGMCQMLSYLQRQSQQRNSDWVAPFVWIYKLALFLCPLNYGRVSPFKSPNITLK